jgi:hypothetical protein
MSSQHVKAFAAWVETRPVQNVDFDSWLESFWPQYEKQCGCICKNIYVMCQCVAAFEQRLRIGMTWDQAMGNTALKRDMEDICASVHLCSDDFFSGGAQTAFETRCTKIFNEKMN